MPGPAIDSYNRGVIVGRALSGLEASEIARIEGQSRTTVASIIKHDIHPTGPRTPPVPRTGRPRIITSPKRRVVLAAIDQNRHIATKTLVNDHQISRRSVYRIAKSVGLRSDKEERVPEINRLDESARLTWTMLREQHDLRDYLYTDEAGFTIKDSSQDTYVFRTPQERLDRNKTHARVPRFRAVIAWGAVAYDYKPPLWILPKTFPTPNIYPPPMNPPARPNGGTLNQVKYAVHVLQGRIWPMFIDMRAMGRNPVVVEDGAAPHNGEIPERIRQQLGIRRFFHPAHSPDLNAIENVWAVLKQRIEARRPMARTRDESIVHIEEEWARIPMDVVNHACESIARRVQEVRDAGGYATGH